MTERPKLDCPSCGEEASGKFCDQCGAQLQSSFCGSCGAEMAGGADFCGRCGQSTKQGASSRNEPKTPWIVAGTLSALAVALVLWSATKRGDGQAPGVTAVAGANATGAAGIPPNLDDIAPRDQFTRLNDRVMAAANSGDSTSVIQFWPMAEQAYHMMPAEDRDVDAMYHMATLQLLVGRTPAALALADTMMSESPDNLLAWYLRGVTAEYQGDTTRVAEAKSEFARVYSSELATGRQEYLDHADVLAAYLNPVSQ